MPERIVSQEAARFAELEERYQEYWHVVEQLVPASVHTAFPKKEYDLAFYGAKTTGSNRIMDQWVGDDYDGKPYRNWLYGVEGKKASKIPFMHYSINWFPNDGRFKVTVWTGSLEHTIWDKKEGIAPFELAQALKEAETSALPDFLASIKAYEARKK